MSNDHNITHILHLSGVDSEALLTYRNHLSVTRHKFEEFNSDSKWCLIYQCVNGEGQCRKEKWHTEYFDSAQQVSARIPTCFDLVSRLGGQLIYAIFRPKNPFSFDDVSRFGMIREKAQMNG